MPVLLAGKLTKDETTHLPLATTTNFGSVLEKTKKNLMNPLTGKKETNIDVNIIKCAKFNVMLTQVFIIRMKNRFKTYRNRIDKINLNKKNSLPTFSVSQSLLGSSLENIAIKGET